MQMLRLVLSMAALALCFAAVPLAQGAPASPDTRAVKAAATVNLNTATVIELQELPGVGARTAERIVEYRQKNGPFKKIEELMNVQGIGEKSFLKLRSQITVSGKPETANQQH
jgi:competence protein ComEA